MNRYLVFFTLMCFSFVILLFINSESISRDPTREPAQQREYGKAVTNDLSNHLQKYLRFIPDQKLSDSIKSYIGEVSQIHNGANESIEVNNQTYISQNSCFAQLATEFYLDLIQEDLQQLPKRVKMTGRPLGIRIAMDEEAGKGFWQNRRPGFLWEKLMTLTGNNPNLAIQIIKMCGHDDAINERPHLIPAHSNYSNLNRRKREIYTQALNSWNDAPDWIKEALIEQRDNNRINFGCWNSSALYLPKALGEGLTISDGLKSRIVKIQAPKKGAKALPAKNYHVLAGLFTGCRFKSETGYSFVGANIARLGARYYRAKSLGASRLSVIEITKSSLWNQLNPSYFTPEILDEIRKKRLNQKDSVTPDDRTMILLNLLKLSDEELKKASNSELKEHILKNISIKDAAILWKSWYQKTNIPGVGDLYLPNRSRRPEYFNSQFGVPYSLSNKNSCENGWPNERCQAAIAVMDTWEIDFEWSQEAQYVGAREGEKTCTKAEKQDVEKSACEVLRAREVGKKTLRQTLGVDIEQKASLHENVVK